MRSDNESKLLLLSPNKGEDRKLPKRIELVSNDEEILVVMGNGGDNEDNEGVVVNGVVVVRAEVEVGVLVVVTVVDDNDEIS